jgi:hypothetical protein
MLTVVYDNKYVGMVYDRFASLDPKQQKQVILGIFGGILALIVGYMSISYIELWNTGKRVGQANDMITMLQQYQKDQRQESASLAALERSSQLASPEAFKKMIYQYAQAASISSRTVRIDERGEAKGDAKLSDIKVKQATVTLERINLTQLREFLANLEFKEPNVGISSISVKNDEKLRGYMSATFSIIVYLFQSEQG